MRIELPSGNWVEIREALKAKDKFAVQNAVKFTMTDGKQQEFSAGIQNEMRAALLGQVITAWSFEGIPIPSTGLAPAAVVLGETLDIDDYNELEKQTDDLFEKVRLAGGRSPN